MFKERCTYRRVIIQNGTPLGQKIIYFGIQLANFRFESSGQNPIVGIPNIIKYPQKHTVDFKIYGANGPNGFILDSSYGMNASLSTVKNHYMNGKGPILFAHALSILTGGDGGGSSLTGDWFVDEPEYVSQGLSTADKSPEYNFNFDMNANTIYTRPATPTSVVDQHAYGDVYRVRKGLSLLYSERNIVTFRVTVEVLSEDERFVSIRKFTGGESLS